MALDRITLTSFRNHADSRLDGTAQINLLVGENGAGKTNVLEALSLLAPGRGLRGAALPAMACATSEAGFAVSAHLHSGAMAEPVRLGTGLAPSPLPGGRRMVQINGARASVLSLGEWLAIGWLTPAMDQLFAQGAASRRRYMDRLAIALDPLHARHAARHEAALRERNRLLAQPSRAKEAWLAAIEAQLAEHGAHLAQGRAALVEALTSQLAHLPPEPFARPTLAYQPGGPIEPEDLARALAAGRERDRAAQRTLTGPQRDDLLVSLQRPGAGDQAMPATHCSTGEQKAMLIAMTLAHTDLAARGRPSVLLLDEVAAHLDPLRRTALFERLHAGGAQVWLTGTEPLPFAKIHSEAAIWQVAAGTLQRG